MKHEIDSKAALEQWLALPSRSNEVVFQGLDLRPYELQFLALDLRGCLFIGCRTTDKLAAHISKFKCISIPPLPGKPFDAGWEAALQRIAARTRPAKPRADG